MHQVRTDQQLVESKRGPWLRFYARPQEPKPLGDCMTHDFLPTRTVHFTDYLQRPSSFRSKTNRSCRKSLLRFLATAILSGSGVLTLGCSSHLPYYISIDSEGSASPAASRCVLPLDQIAKTVVEDLPSDDLMAQDSVRALQRRFELAIAAAEFELGVSSRRPEFINSEDDERLATRVHDRLAGRHCEPPSQETKKDGLLPTKLQMRQAGAQYVEPLKPGQPPAEFWLRQAGQKWMATYSLDPTNPDHSLNRFEEFVRSSQLFQALANKPLQPDETEQRSAFIGISSKLGMFVEHVRDDGSSQWCGKPESPCREQRSLYKMITKPDNLYTKKLPDLITNISSQTEPRRRHQHRIIILGYQLPWDEDRTLIRYGVTFYFADWLEPDKETTTTQFLGYDLVYANEATPAPRHKEEKIEQNSDRTPLWSVASNWAGYPFSAAIGLKNAAFEITKLPFSLGAALVAGRDPLNYPLQTFINAQDALAVEFGRPRRGIAASLYRFLTETPLVGQAFQYNWGSDWSEPDQLPLELRRKIFLSRGIYGGHKWGQDTGLWTAFAQQTYPPMYDVYSPPYRHGTAIDVAWSMFNLSHGPAYTEARYVMDNADPDDRIYLAGHSGGVQRSAAASRILWHHRYRVIKVLGIAGPSIGQAFVDLRYPEAFPVYLSSGEGANDDIVSTIGLVAGGFSTVLRYSIIVPAKYIVGSFCLTVTRCRDAVYSHADRIGYSNAEIMRVEQKPSSQHQTPFRLALSNRLIFDAYVRSEFATAFREDLERPMRPHRTDRPAAFDWEQ